MSCFNDRSNFMKLEDWWGLGEPFINSSGEESTRGAIVKLPNSFKIR